MTTTYLRPDYEQPGGGYRDGLLGVPSEVVEAIGLGASPEAFDATWRAQSKARDDALMDAWRLLSKRDIEQVRNRITEATLGTASLPATADEHLHGEGALLAFARTMVHFNTAAAEVTVGMATGGATAAVAATKSALSLIRSPGGGVMNAVKQAAHAMPRTVDGWVDALRAGQRPGTSGAARTAAEAAEGGTLRNALNNAARAADPDARYATRVKTTGPDDPSAVRVPESTPMGPGQRPPTPRADGPAGGSAGGGRGTGARGAAATGAPAQAGAGSGAVVRRTGRELVEHGKRGVKTAVEYLETQGYEILGREVTIKAAGVRTRIDLAARAPDGKIVFAEVQHGARAGLSRNQRIALPEIQRVGGIPQGQHAMIDEVMRPGKQLEATPVILARVENGQVVLSPL